MKDLVQSLAPGPHPVNSECEDCGGHQLPKPPAHLVENTTQASFSGPEQNGNIVLISFHGQCPQNVPALKKQKQNLHFFLTCYTEFSAVPPWETAGQAGLTSQHHIINIQSLSHNSAFLGLHPSCEGRRLAASPWWDYWRCSLQWVFHLPSLSTASKRLSLQSPYSLSFHVPVTTEFAWGLLWSTLIVPRNRWCCLRKLKSPPCPYWEHWGLIPFKYVNMSHPLCAVHSLERSRLIA